MINVITGVGGNAFDALAYPVQSMANSFYIETQFQNFSNTLNDVGRQFMESAKGIYDRINSSEALRMARVAINSARGMLTSNQILQLESLEACQAAQPSMQRWVMANPVVRELYHAQRCSGYADTYTDLHPGDIGEAHYDYRRVMDGVIVETEDDWYARFYMEDLVGDDRELTHDEKVVIMNTWDLVELFIKKGEDATDPFGGKL